MVVAKWVNPKSRSTVNVVDMILGRGQRRWKEKPTKVACVFTCLHLVPNMCSDSVTRQIISMIAEDMVKAFGLTNLNSFNILFIGGFILKQ